MPKKTLTNAERVTRSRDRAVESGARRIGPLLLRDAVAIDVLDALVVEHGSIRAALEHALHGAKKRA